MKILFVNHTFPPESYAGSELCVLNLCHALQQRGHHVAVFYRFADPQQNELDLIQDEFQGIPVFRINHTYRFAHTFQDIYLNPSIDAKFSYLLYTWQPDVVHFHHMTNLSLGMAKEAKAYGAATVFTLHDYWLLCQRGQLLKRDLTLCHGPSDHACRKCLSTQLLRGNTQRWVTRLFNAGHNQKSNKNQLDLLLQMPIKIETPNKEFVGCTSFGMGELENQVLLAHPPAEIHFQISTSDQSVFKAAIGLHPTTYDKNGSGVCFEVIQDYQVIYKNELNPKQHPSDQGWHEIKIPLHAKNGKPSCLMLRTSPQAGEDNQFCTAGWRQPVIQINNSNTTDVKSDFQTPSTIQRAIKHSAEWVADRIVMLSETAKEGIEHRKRWIQKVWQDIDLFLSPSEFLRHFFIRHGLPEEKIVFSDNGFIIPQTPSTKPVSSPLVFGYIGTWIPSKGVDLAVKAFQNIDPQKAKLIVHGFFPGYHDFEDYEEYLRSLAGPAVKFRGKYEPENVYNLLAELDCLIMPSIWWENSPMTLHETFLAKTPVITANVGGMAEQVKQGGGLTFRHRDEQDLRKVIDRLIEQPQELETLRASIPCVKSVDEHTEEILEHYKRLLKIHSSKES